MSPQQRESRKRRLSAEARRENLLAVARAAFIANGVDGTGMRQIAAMAKVDPALLYQHFSSKEELFEAAVVQAFQEILPDMQDAGRQLFESPIEQKAESIRFALVRLLRVTVEIAPLISAAIFSDQERGRKLYTEHIVPVFAATARAAREGVGSWIDHPLDYDLLVTGVFTMCFGLAMDAVYQSRPLDVEHVSTELANMLARSIALPGPAAG